MRTRAVTNRLCLKFLSKKKKLKITPVFAPSCTMFLVPLAAHLGMHWPAHIVTMFESIPAGGLTGATDEAVLYGPINMLLVHLFPPTDLYIVSPQWKKKLPAEGSSTTTTTTTADFTTVFVVQNAHHPVFFLQVKPASSFSSRSARAAADVQMRNTFDELIDDLAIPTLHGISALGPHLSFYAYSKEENTIHPTLILCDPDQDNDRAPAERWDTELMSENAVQRLNAVANHVKEMVNDHLRHDCLVFVRVPLQSFLTEPPDALHSKYIRLNT